MKNTLSKKKNLSIDIDYYKNSFINLSLDFLTPGITPPDMPLLYAPLSTLIYF